MNKPEAGISYYHKRKDDFFSTESDPDTRAKIRLTMELLLENEDRYQARAKYLLKNHMLRVQFGDDLVEYVINNKQASYGLWEEQGNCFRSLEVIGLSLGKKKNIISLVELFASSEAGLILGL